MPEWLEMRCAQCSLKFVDGVYESDAVAGGDACMDRQQPCATIHTSVYVCKEGDITLQKQQLLIQSQQQQQQQQHHHHQQQSQLLSRHPPCSLRWQNLVPSNPHVPACIAHHAELPPTCRSEAVLEAHAECADVSLAALASRDASQVISAAAKSKKHKKEHSRSSFLASPPKVYRDDAEYQRYFAASNDVSEWVRKTLLDR